MQTFVCRHLDTLRLLALALGPLLQQFIADTQLYQDTSVFVDEGVAQCMMSGQSEAMDDTESCEADFLQYDLGTYEGALVGAWHCMIRKSLCLSKTCWRDTCGWLTH